MKKIFIIILLTGIIAVSYAADENAGTTGFTFSRLSFSPRASAMGSAYAGIANDAEAVFFNPGGLYQLQDSQLNAVYMSYLDGINCGSLIFAKPIDDRSAYAIYSRFLSTSETKTLSDDQGNYLGTDGTFGFLDLEAGGALSYHITNSLNLGATAKMLFESIDGHSASMFAVDLGIYHITENENLHIGISLRNLGFQRWAFTSSEYEENLPSLVDLGFGFQINPKILLAADFYKPFKNDYYTRFGLEIAPMENLKIRAGYKSDAADWKTGGSGEKLAGLTGGFGINWDRYEFSYAILSYGDLGLVNQLGINYKLKGNK
ncbi:MAG: PorV/PorQ family protein [Candidatus Stygibacter australis]|nr:PorV/PorQ family protein [Candidatus Stygibacter australis]MDP8323306.1 PorV/PorQ family protein [Candidatus Stygibacter australis]